MADRRNSRRQRALRALLYRAVCDGCRNALVDAHLRSQLGAHPAMLRLRHHPLPPDGRRHHLQAWLGLHRRYRCRGRRLFRFGRAHR